MSQMLEFRVGVVQMNPILGDIVANARAVKAYAEQACLSGAQVLVFPELCLTGYPPEDLLLREDFIQAAQAALDGLVVASKSWPHLVLVVGVPLQIDLPKGGGLMNAAVAVNNGALLATHYKHELPNYQVFDEQRYFSPSDGTAGVFKWQGVVFGLSVCEDIWFSRVMASALVQGAQVMLNLNASPFHRGKQSLRHEVLGHRLAQASDANSLVVVYANQVGGQDELVFDGGSTVICGDQMMSLPRFEEGVGFVDLKVVDNAPVSAWLISPAEVQSQQEAVMPVLFAESKLDSKFGLEDKGAMKEVFQALVLGTRDYVRKNGFNQVMLGLSGGIDSALTLAIAVAAVGAKSVHAVMMPFEYTSAMSIEDATSQAEHLGVQFSVLPIQGIYQSVVQGLEPLFEGLSQDTTEENIQARSRGVLLMALSNKFHGLVLTTGNKSELAVGYSTLYGDMAGGFNPIKDLPKTQVYLLAAYLNHVGSQLGFPEGEVIPQRVIERPASAELRPDQTDQDSLPEYAVLDEILRRFIEMDENPEEIIAAGFDAEQVRDTVRRVKLNEHKRRQAPLGVRMSLKAFGRDRRYPITARW